MDIVPFRNTNVQPSDEDNPPLRLNNRSKNVNYLDDDFVNLDLSETEEKKKQTHSRETFLENEITGLKLPRKNRVGKKLIYLNSNEKAKLGYNYSTEHKKKAKTNVPKGMSVLHTPSNRSERSDYIKESDCRLLPVIPKNLSNNNYMNTGVIIPYQKLQEICSVVENQKNQKCRDVLIYSPDIIQRWIRVVLNVVITSLIFTFIYYVFVSVREDINKKIAIQKQNIKDDSMLCKKQYEAHKCGTVNLPLLTDKCDEWLKCMKADSNLYQDISFLSAQMLGQIINAFIVQFEWKSICVIAFIFILIFIGSNYALSIGSGNRYNEDVRYAPPVSQYPPPYHNYPVVPSIYNPVGTINPMPYNMRYANIPPHPEPFGNSFEFASTRASDNVSYQPYDGEHFYEEKPSNTNKLYRFFKRKGQRDSAEHKHTPIRRDVHGATERNNFAPKKN